MKKEGTIFQPWLVVMFVKIFTTRAGILTSNPCADSEKNGMKTWGPGCQFTCKCAENVQCDSSGFCPTGCIQGWSSSRNRSCSLRTLRKVINRKHAVFPDSSDNVGKNKRGSRRRGVSSDKILYTLHRDGVCALDSNGSLTKIWRVDNDPPVQVRRIRITFDIPPRGEGRITCRFTLASFSEYSVTKELTQNAGDRENQFSMTSPEPVIASSVTITMRSPGNITACIPATIREFFAYALPVCPYRKWGIRCNFHCPCPCEVSECHPTSGICNFTGFTCPARKFGPNCNHACSSKCLGKAQMCHPLTGTCLECGHHNLTGVNCESVVSLTDWTSRRCSMFDQPLNKSKITYDNITDSILLEDLGELTGQTVAVGIVILLVVLAVILAFIVHIRMVHYCAKKRFKDHQAKMEEERRQRYSMVTYTEFSKEFIEMQECRKKSCLSGASSPSDQGIPHPVHRDVPLTPIKSLVNDVDAEYNVI